MFGSASYRVSGCQPEGATMDKAPARVTLSIVINVVEEGRYLLW
jgi:hypothetical protein